jgi:hypothetical protein
MLTGCGGSQPPITAPGTMPQSRSIAQQAARGKSWMLPEASGEDLLYVGAYDQSYQHGEVFIYSYSNQQLVGTLTGFANPEGLCVDAAGNVYVTDSSTTQRVYEYPHGGLKAKRTIETPGPPYGCGINPINGDLAIASLTGSGGVGQVYVYKRARGRPKTYSTPNIWRLFASSYDVSGNLFIIGYNEGSSGTIYKMAELPRGQAKLRIVNTHAIGHVSEAHYPHSRGPAWILGNTLVAPSESHRGLGFYNYPDGGRTTRRYHRNEFQFIYGAAIAPSH